jgi:hypothetical protein
MLQLEKSTIIKHEEQFSNFLDTFRYLEKYLKTIENGCVFVSDMTIFGLHYQNIKWVHCLHPFYFSARYDIATCINPKQTIEISNRDLTLAVLDLYINCKNLLNILNRCPYWKELFPMAYNENLKELEKGLNNAFFAKSSQKFKLIITILDILFRKLFNMYFDGPIYKLPWFSNSPLLLALNGITFFSNPPNTRILTNSELLPVFTSLLDPTPTHLSINIRTCLDRLQLLKEDLRKTPDSLFKDILIDDQEPNYYTLPQCAYILTRGFLNQLFSQETDFLNRLPDADLLSSKLKKAIQVLFNKLLGMIYDVTSKYLIPIKARLHYFNKKFTATTKVFPDDLKTKTTLSTPVSIKVGFLKFNLDPVDKFTNKLVNSIQKAPHTIKKISQPIKNDQHFLELLSSFIYDLLLYFESIPIIFCDGNIDVGVSVC